MEPDLAQPGRVVQQSADALAMHLFSVPMDPIGADVLTQRFGEPQQGGEPIAVLQRPRAVGNVQPHQLFVPGCGIGFGDVTLSRFAAPGQYCAMPLPGAHQSTEHQGHSYRNRSPHCRLISPRELPQTIEGAGRRHRDGLLLKMALDVQSEPGRTVVAACAVLLQTLHCDPIQVATNQFCQMCGAKFALRGDRRETLLALAQPCAGARRFFYADAAESFVEGSLVQVFAAQRRCASQQFVEKHAQAVDVAAGVDVELVQLSLLRGHVFEGPNHGAEAGEEGALSQLLAHGFGYAEVNHLRHRPAIIEGHEHVGRFDVAVDDALLMGVLDGLADGHQ